MSRRLSLLLFRSLPAACLAAGLAGCGPNTGSAKASCHARKFDLSPGSGRGTAIISFSGTRSRSIEVYLVENGTSRVVWTGTASATSSGTAPYLAITPYGKGPDDITPSRLHFWTTSQEQHILELPGGKLLTASAGFSRSDCIGKVINWASIYPENWNGHWALYDAGWDQVSDYEVKSRDSGWKYVVTVAK